MSITKNKIQVDNNDQEYILYRIDIHFTEYLFWQQKLMKKVIKTLEKKLNCTFIESILGKKIMMQTMKLLEYKLYQ